MGFFSNLSASYDLANAADAINDCLVNGLLPYVSKYVPGQKFSRQDSPYIKASVTFIEQKVQYMQERMQGLSFEKRMTTMVRCSDGHMTAVPGYVMAMKELCMKVRKDLPY